MKLKRPNSLCGILLCLMICPSVVAQTTQGAQIRMHYERAQKDLQANQPEDAKLEFQAILKLDPNNAAMELSNRKDIDVFVTGGHLRGDWFSMVGP